MSGQVGETATLLQDDFNAPLDPTVWDYNRFEAGSSFYGRTQQRQELPAVSNGLMHLELDAFNPTNQPGNPAFQGSEAITNQVFSLDGGGIAFEARARLVDPVGGIVGGIFGYNFNATTHLHDEIDSETLSNEVVSGSNREQTNVYNQEPLGPGHTQFVPITGTLTDFHTYRMEWLPDRVRWFIDGQLVREDLVDVPQQPMAMHLNIWAPDQDWIDAFDRSLQPDTNPSDTKYFFDVDYVHIARLLPAIFGTGGNETLIGTTQNDWIDGQGGNDTLNGVSGSDTLIGGPGADKFVFDGTALADAQVSTPIFDRIADYDAGNSGAFAAAEGDQIDLSTLLSAAFNHGSGQPVSALVRAIASGTGTDLQIDTDGIVGGTSWTTIARLDGVHAGDSVIVILDASQPAGTTITVDKLSGNDFNGDLTSDILWRQDSGFVGAWLMQNAQVNAGVPVGFAAGGDEAAGLGDFNGDGTSDILWRNDSGFVGEWLMQGGHIDAGVQIGFAAGGDHVAGTGDFNGDGTSDILFRSDSGFVGEWLMQGGHINAGISVGFAAGGDHVAGIGDFNGDGTSDILWRNDSGFVGLWQMQNGQINAGVSVGFAAGGDHVAGIGDLNGDGTSDILWRNDSGSVGLWLMQGDHINAGLAIGFVNNTWHIAAVGDYNGDGHADILWRNDSGQVGVWLLNGNQILAGATLGSAPADWHVIA